MIYLFLQWNADDPVSDVEEQCNPVSESKQGNRNPFIDNPALATKIWNDPQAEGAWSTLAVAKYDSNNFVVYPNPSNTHSINIVLNNQNLADIILYNVSVQLVYKHKMTTKKQTIPNLATGFYILKVTTNNKTAVKKVVVN